MRGEDFLSLSGGLARVLGRDRVCSDSGAPSARVHESVRDVFACAWPCRLALGRVSTRAVCRRCAVGIGGRTSHGCRVAAGMVVCGRVLSCIGVSYRVSLGCHVMSSGVMSCYAMSCRVMSCCVALCVSRHSMASIA